MNEFLIDAINGAGTSVIPSDELRAKAQTICYLMSEDNFDEARKVIEESDDTVDLAFALAFIFVADARGWEEDR